MRGCGRAAPRPALAAYPDRQRRHGRLSDQVGEVEVQALPLRLGADPQRQDRVAADGVVVLVDADAGTSSTRDQIAASVRSTSCAVLRRLVPLRRAGRGQRRDGRACRSAVSGIRSIRTKKRGHHEVRQVPRRCAAEPCRIEVCARPRSSRPDGCPGRRRCGPRRPRRGPREAGEHAAATSPSSTRLPRILTWPSRRPRYSRLPSASQRARSPVRYIRSPARNGSATNPRAVRSGRSR